MLTRIYLNPANKIGFEYLEYGFSNSKAQLNLFIDECNFYFAGEKNTNRIFFNAIATQETLNPPITQGSIKNVSTIKYKISGHRKAYRALLKIRQEPQYQWGNNDATLYIEQYISELEKILLTRLPVYRFWSTSSQPCSDQSDIEQHQDRVTKIINDKQQILFSKSITKDNKRTVLEQLNSIYHRALLGERACIDVMSFDGVHRKSLDSLAIDNFISMAYHIAAKQFHSLDELVQMGLAGLDVARLVFKNTDFHLHNYGTAQNKAGKKILAVIDVGQAAWDLTCRYYGIDPNKSYKFPHPKGHTFTIKAPTLALSFSKQDVIKLPFVIHTQFHYAPANSLVGAVYTDIHLPNLEGIERHPQYIQEKYYHFLKAILFPPSFHKKVHYGFMPNSKLTEECINYREKNNDYARGILFQCDDFWLHFADNPEWLEKIQSEFNEFNQEMQLYFNANELMVINDVNKAYETIIPICINNLPGILEKKSEEVKKILRLYQHFKSEDYQTILQNLVIALANVTNYRLQLSEQANIPSTKLIPIFNNIDSLFIELERCDKSHDLPCQYKIYRAITSFEQEHINLEEQKLFKYILFNRSDKIEKAINNNTLTIEHLNFQLPDMEPLTAIELALAYNRKEIVEQLFRLENTFDNFKPDIRVQEPLMLIAKEVREAGKSYFLDYCSSSKKFKKIGFFKLHDVEQRMHDIFNLFRCLKKPVENITDFKQNIHYWAKDLKKGSTKNSKLEEKVMKALEQHYQPSSTVVPPSLHSNKN